MESSLTKVLKYYSFQFWDDHGDPFISSYFGMQYPFFFLSLGFNAILFCKFWGPSFMKDRKPFDVRPICIISNGLAFGTYMIGVLLGIYCSDYMTECFSCFTYDRNSTYMPHICLRYLGYMMVWTKVYDFSIPILSVLGKKEEKITNLQMAHLMFALFYVYTGAKTNPGGIVILVALVDTFYQLLVYGYLVMAAASTELKPNKSFRFYLFVFRDVSIALTFIHQLYFLFQTDCSTPIEVRIFSTAYCGLTTIFYPIDCYMRLRNRSVDIQEINSENQVLTTTKSSHETLSLDSNQNRLIKTFT